MKSRRISRRFLGIFCLALVAALPLARAWGYTKMENDRILFAKNSRASGGFPSKCKRSREAGRAKGFPGQP